MKKLAIILMLLISVTCFGSRWLKEDTADTVLVGPFLDATDGKTLETALDVTGWTCNIFKDTDAATALTVTASAGDNDATHKAMGMYSLELTAANVDTAGRFFVVITDANALPVWHEFMIMPVSTYGFVDGGDYPHVDALQVNGSTPISTTNISAAVWNAAISTYDTAATFGLTNQVAVESAADIKTAIEAGGSSIASILADTGELQTDWADGGRLDLILDTAAAGGGVTANDIWNAVMADHLTPGSTGAKLNTGGGGGRYNQ